MRNEDRCPAEVEVHPYPAPLTPGGTSALVATGHEALPQARVGVGPRFADEAYAAVGAHVRRSADAVCDQAEMVCTT